MKSRRAISPSAPASSSRWNWSFSSSRTKWSKPSAATWQVWRKFQRGTSNIQHPTSNIQHPTSNIQHPTSNIQHPTSNIQHPTSKFRLSTLNPQPSTDLGLGSLAQVLGRRTHQVLRR